MTPQHPMGRLVTGNSLISMLVTYVSIDAATLTSKASRFALSRTGKPRAVLERGTGALRGMLLNSFFTTTRLHTDECRSIPSHVWVGKQMDAPPQQHLTKRPTLGANGDALSAVDMFNSARTCPCTPCGGRTGIGTGTLIGEEGKRNPARTNSLIKSRGRCLRRKHTHERPPKHFVIACHGVVLGGC